MDHLDSHRRYFQSLHDVNSEHEAGIRGLFLIAEIVELRRQLVVLDELRRLLSGQAPVIPIGENGQTNGHTNGHVTKLLAPVPATPEAPKTAVVVNRPEPLKVKPPRKCGWRYGAKTLSADKIEEALDANGRVIVKTAKELDMSVAWLKHQMRVYGIMGRPHGTNNSNICIYLVRLDMHHSRVYAGPKNYGKNFWKRNADKLPQLLKEAYELYREASEDEEMAQTWTCVKTLFQDNGVTLEEVIDV